MHGNERDAPKPAVRGTATERLESTHNGRSRLRGGNRSSCPEPNLGDEQVRLWLTFLNWGRDVGVVLDRFLRTVDAKHYVERAGRYRQPIGHRHTGWELLGHVN
jgi:hypothetical protein